MLERRLDNVVYMLGFSHSRTHARQLISHGHFCVNDRKVDIPSALVKVGDVVRFKDRSATSEDMKALVASNKNKSMPGWLEVDWDGMKGRVLALPQRADVTPPGRRTLDRRALFEIRRDPNDTRQAFRGRSSWNVISRH